MPLLITKKKELRIRKPYHNKGNIFNKMGIFLLYALSLIVRYGRLNNYTTSLIRQDISLSKESYDFLP